LNREHDDDTGGDMEGLEENLGDAEASLCAVLIAIPKVCF
jgi:hypothetical protein